jgi:hypothetical protein
VSQLTLAKAFVNQILRPKYQRLPILQGLKVFDPPKSG